MRLDGRQVATAGGLPFLCRRGMYRREQATYPYTALSPWWSAKSCVLGLMLPEIDGLEVCRILKEEQKTSGIKIILLTARVDDEAKLTALKNGADDFLTKPFNKQELEIKLSNFLKVRMLEKDSTLVWL